MKALRKKRGTPRFLEIAERNGENYVKENV